MGQATQSIRPVQRIPLGWKRWLGCTALGWASATCRGMRPRREKDAVAPIFILEPYGMGDVISLEPLVRELRRQDREVRLGANAAWHELFPDHTNMRWVNTRIPWTSYDDGRKYGLREFFSDEFRRCRAELRGACNGAIGLDTRGDPRSVMLLWRAGCREVYSLSHYLGSNFRNVRSAAQAVEFVEDIHRWQMNLRFLAPLGLSTTPGIAPPEFPHLAPKRTVTPKRLGFIPIAPWTGKSWGRGKWQELQLQLVARGFETVGLCGPQQTAAAQLELGTSVPVQECTALAAWAQELTACRLVVSVDTGPMHLADALRVPTLALFGQGKLPLWSPNGPRSAVIHHQEAPDFKLCHPVEENAWRGRIAMERISVAEVADAVQILTR